MKQLKKTETNVLSFSVNATKHLTGVRNKNEIKRVGFNIAEVLEALARQFIGFGERGECEKGQKVEEFGSSGERELERGKSYFRRKRWKTSNLDGSGRKGLADSKRECFNGAIMSPLGACNLCEPGWRLICMGSL